MSELDQASGLTGSTAPKSFLFYGPPGSGKTTYAAYLSDASGKLLRKLWVDVDDKIREMENLPADVRGSITAWSCNEPPGDPEKIQIPSAPNPKDPHKGTIIEREPRGMRRTVDCVNELLALARNCRREGKPFPYDVVVVDSLTSCSEHTIRKVMYDQRIAFMSERNWGLVSQTLIEFYRGFLQLPCERILIAHSRTYQVRDRESDTILEEYIRPHIVGQLAETIAKDFSEVYFFHGRERSGQYKIQTVKDRLLVARTTRDIPPEIFIDPKTKQLILEKK